MRMCEFESLTALHRTKKCVGGSWPVSMPQYD
jgi:hypothetical protein